MLRIVAAALAIAAVLLPSPSRADYVEVPSRGMKIPALLLKPDQPSTTGVILYAGGLGRLDISRDGSIGMLRRNQVVRTRDGYRKAGFLTLVADLAPDMKVGRDDVKQGYRETKAYADDMGAMVAYLRSAGATRVVVIGTSRGTLTIANGVSRLSGAGARRPDAAVMTSGYWKVGARAPGFTIWKLAGQGNASLMNLPTQLLWHRNDGCVDTRAADVPAFRKWLESGGAKVAAKEFMGGSKPESDPCEAFAPHGFFGLDGEVVATISDWIRQLP